MNVFQRAVLMCAAVAVASPVWARQVVPASDKDDPAKPQVQTFESVLRSAVETGGQNFAKRAALMLQDMPSTFTPGDAPVVNGIALHDMGIFSFQVQIPNILLQVAVMNTMVNRGQPPVFGPGGATQPVSGRVTADAGRIAADPMGPLPGDTPPPDFGELYRVQVHDALVDAMLDNSGVLPLAPNDTLLVVASGTDPVVPNFLLKEPSRKLRLSIKGADLLDFRQGKLTRDEVKRRITETHF